MREVIAKDVCMIRSNEENSTTYFGLHIYPDRVHCLSMVCWCANCYFINFGAALGLLQAAVSNHTCACIGDCPV